MSNLLSTGAAWLAAQLAANASQPATYVDGALSCPLSVTLGRTEFPTVSAAGAIETFVSRDFILPPASLVLNGVQVPPRRGALINATIGGIAGVYQIMAPGAERHYKLDAQAALLRIHTKQVS